MRMIRNNVPLNDDEAMWLFAPNGQAISQIMTSGYRYGDIQGFNSDGDSITLEETALPNSSSIWLCHESIEWLPEHCREVIVPGDFGGDDEITIPAWPEDIQRKCMRMLRLLDGIRGCNDMLGYLPQDFATDPNITVVIKRFIRDRAEAEIEQLRAEIDAFRKTNVEPTHAGLDYEDEEPEE